MWHDTCYAHVRSPSCAATLFVPALILPYCRLKVAVPTLSLGSIGLVACAYADGSLTIS